MAAMAKLPIISAPDPRLKGVATPVDTVDDDVRQLMDDMLETMYAAPGIGLAAPQVGVSKRIIVVDITDPADGPKNPALQMVNPEVVTASDDTNDHEEGCLSLPNQFGTVTRPAAVTVRYIDRDGEERTIEADGMLATCIQHEIDHLDGLLFVDHMSSLKRGMILRKLTKMKRTGDLPDYAEEQHSRVA